MLCLTIIMKPEHSNVSHNQSDIPLDLLKDIIDTCKMILSRRKCWGYIDTDLNLATDIKHAVNR